RNAIGADADQREHRGEGNIVAGAVCAAPHQKGGVTRAETQTVRQTPARQPGVAGHVLRLAVRIFSDERKKQAFVVAFVQYAARESQAPGALVVIVPFLGAVDRKSTRLNSSHVK